jgi:site-specific recombinase XerD
MIKEGSSNHRTTAIKTSFVRMNNMPKSLVLFKVTASKYYWVRFYYEGKMYRKTTETEVLSDAKTIARDFYLQIITNATTYIPKTSKGSFEKCAIKLIRLQQSLVDRNERSKRLNVNDNSILQNYMIEHFKKYDIRKIDREVFEEYFSKLSKKGLKKTSQKKHINLLSKIFKLAYEDDVIDKLPRLPNISTVDNPRPWFTKDEYKHLLKTVKELIKEKIKVRGHLITDELRLLITFMINSFIRPTDLKHLKHRNIREGQTEKNRKVLHISYEHAKVKNRRTTNTMEACVGIYNDLVNYQQESKEPHSKDDYLFFPSQTNRDFALRIIARQFDFLLHKAELKLTAQNESRSLYSLRHSSISFRVLDGVDSFIIASNALTSVDMVDRFYLSHLKNEMSAENIQLKNKK